MIFSHFAYIDLIVIALVFTLAFKGLINGSIKELINLFATIGAIFIATRLATPLAKWLEAQGGLFHIGNLAILHIVSFAILLLIVWAVIYFIGGTLLYFVKLPLKPIDRFLGFLIAGVKYFLIISIIIFALSQTKLIKDRFASWHKQSLLYPYIQKSAKVILGESIKVKN